MPVGHLVRWNLTQPRRLVAAFWLILAVVGMASASSATDALSPQYVMPPGYEGTDTSAAIQHTYSTSRTPLLVPVITLPRGVTVDTPGVETLLAEAFDAVQAAMPRARIASYASTGDRAFVSADGRTAFGLVYLYAGPSVPVDPYASTIQHVLADHPLLAHGSALRESTCWQPRPPNAAAWA